MVGFHDIPARDRAHEFMTESDAFLCASRVADRRLQIEATRHSPYATWRIW